MILRPYQDEAKQAIRKALNNGSTAPLCCLPTGSGKTPVITTLLSELSNKLPNERFVCAVHTQELVAQLAGTYEKVTGRKSAVYSASLKRREFGPVVFAQIQSIYRKACDFGRVALLCIDECDRIPLDGDGQYRTFIKESKVINPDLRVCGFTATPYRTGTGLIFGKGKQFDAMVYDADVRQLIDAGFLSPLVSKDGGRPNLKGVAVRNGDYASDQLELAMSEEGTVRQAIEEIMYYGQDRKAWLIFCSGLKHATLVSEALKSKGIEAPIIEGNTSNEDRKEYIRRYRAKELRCLININVLSVGFDAPHVDLLALLRPTLSPGLYYQQVGRGLRVVEGKQNCLVLDLAGNIYKHGPIDTLNQRIKVKEKSDTPGEAPVKTCEECSEIVPAGVRKCPACGWEFPPPKIVKHSSEACDASPLTKTVEHDVTDVSYYVTRPKDVTKPATLCVAYRNNFVEVCRQWITVNPNGNSWAYNLGLRWVIDTPRVEVNGRSLTIDSGVIVGTTNNERVAIGTAEAMLPFCVCLTKPRRIVVRPNANNPKYVDVLKRFFEESNEEPTNLSTS